MKTIQTEIPEQLYKVANGLVKEGWFRDEKEIFSEAIRRFLNSHSTELMEKFILVYKIFLIGRNRPKDKK